MGRSLAVKKNKSAVCTSFIRNSCIRVALFVLLSFTIRASVLLCNTQHTYMLCDFPHSTQIICLKSDILQSRVHKTRRTIARPTQTYSVDGINSREGVVADVPDPVWFPAPGFVRIRQRRLQERGSRRDKIVRAFLLLRGTASVVSHLRLLSLASFLHAYVETFGAPLSPFRFVAASGEVVVEADAVTVPGT